VPGSAPSVDNDLLSSLGETLLVFEHLFDTRVCGVSRVGECALPFGLAPPSTVDPVLGDVHGQAERNPHITRRIAGGESLGRRQPELVQHHIAHEGAAEVLAKLGRDREGEFGVLHLVSVSGLPVEFGRAI